jgi:hypothetical protein
MNVSNFVGMTRVGTKLICKVSGKMCMCQPEGCDGCQIVSPFMTKQKEVKI